MAIDVKDVIKSKDMKKLIEAAKKAKSASDVLIYTDKKTYIITVQKV
jgi:hypothetical protein